ncbi:putative nucleotidyltransferase substrate binding domain-containing protein [Aliivibrio fischeri]|uniref:putative nucleotidyltransferase substrate binding domain-containing protein n=1 Tax=Aliivibrio fischeri TaxID=668 RepID=UPI0007C46703|nr:putative nucleotidyltransferase substrate binding domain-containing protein [Aliivibrio fischeri]
MNNELLPNIVSFLQTISPFDLLPQTALNDIAQTVDILLLGPEETISHEDNATHLYIIRTGVVQQNNLDGTLRAKLGSEDIFGFNLQQNDSEFGYSIFAIENTLLYRFDYTSLMASVEAYPQVASSLALSLKTRLRAQDSKQDNQQHAHQNYLRPNSDIADSTIAIAFPTDTIQAVAHQMRNVVGVSCAFIVDENKHLIGMITDKDMTKRVVAQAKNVHDPISSIMTQEIHTVYEDDLVMSAVQLMMKHNIQNIPVLNHQKQVTGFITPQHLIQNDSVQSIFLLDKIRHADSISTLIDLSKQRSAVFQGMMESNSSPSIIGQVLSMIYDAFTYRLIELAIEQFGQPPCKFTWIVAGSHARNEVHLASDQDNAIILANDATESDRIYFNHFSMYVCKALSELDYTLCKGRFMAATPKWCQKAEIWQEYYRKWSNNPEYELLLNLNVFLEIRPIYGDEELFDSVDSCRHELVSNNMQLTVALVRNALRTRPPLGIFKHLVLEKDGNNNKVLNIKKAAISCMVDFIRIYSLLQEGTALNTTERMEFLHQVGVLNDSTYQDLNETYHYVNRLRFQHQLKAIQNDTPIDSQLQPDLFGSFERQHLKDAFRIVSNFQELMKMKFGV